jgi:FkbM family methyltransferase
MADAIGPAGRVLALEPNPRTAELLKFTLMVNGFLSRTSIVQMAVSDSDGAYLDLVIPKHLGMNATVCREATASDSVVQVETATLDELTKDWPRVDLVKIDAEGAEEAVWRGMHKTVERNPNIIIVFEINCLRCAKPDQFLHSIQEMGFTLRFIDYDSTIQKVTVDQILAGRGGDDWMLFLQRTA